MATPTEPADDPRTPDVRRARPDDVEAIARIWHAGWPDGHLGHVPAELARHRGPDQFLSRARERWETTWVCAAGDEPTGFVVVVDDEVEQIYVDSRARGTGAAAALLGRAQDEIRRAGYSRAWLAVVDGNNRARSFYERQGWQNRGPISYPAETEDGPIEVPCRRYEIALTDPGTSSTD
jgi:GNAT superfamily N-acetyltransferase